MLMKNKVITASFIILVMLLVVSYMVGIRELVVVSGSMEPYIKTGSLCIVNTRASISDIDEGDIVTYSLLDSYITHRAVEVSFNGIITKGDANRVNDIGFVTEDNFQGKVIGHIPYLGYVLFFIKKHIFSIAGIIIAAFTYKEIAEGRRSNENEKEDSFNRSDFNTNFK